MSDWIHVENMLPETGEEFKDVSAYVLVSDGKTTGYGCYDYGFKEWTYYMPGRTEQSDNSITHWKPLPEPPTQKT